MKRRTGRILVVDDLEKWRAILSDTLRMDGFYVDVASTVKEALERLESTFYHLLILDIRMEDSDPDNVQGMQFLPLLEERYGLGTATKAIMLSAYGTPEQMREAFRDYAVTDFLAKHHFDNLAFLEQVRQVINQKLEINLDLQIEWNRFTGKGNAPEQAVTGLWIEDQWVRHNSALQEQLVTELDDLFCRLFASAKSIIVTPLMKGMSGTGVLRIQPFYESGSGQHVVVKYGEVDMIDKEYANFERYVQNYVGGNRRTTVLNLQRTPRLGGISYSLLGTTGTQLENFGDFYKRSTIADIKRFLDHLFLNTCGTWYANIGNLRPLSLSSHYQAVLKYTEESLSEGFERLKTVQGKQQIVFGGLSKRRVFPNPLQSDIVHTQIKSTYECITHGDLNASNILVDEAEQAWLIDFYRTGPGHILRDVAELDTVIRITLLPDEISLNERLELEEFLLSAKSFADVDQLITQFPTNNSAVSKAYASVVHLRQIARNLIGKNPGNHIEEYYLALFYYGINMIRFYKLPVVQREHALLSASLIVEKLERI
ncbi:MAG: response regulator [Caldilineaceae bacterium]|nr:response regulator [Caldilineaceae bacterium]